MTRHSRRLLRTFIAGLLAALPLAATVAIFGWLLSVLLRWLGPSSAVGGVLMQVGLGVTGSEVVGYLLGLAVVVLLIFGLGLLVNTSLQRGAARVLQTVLERIPLVGGVYAMVQKVVGMLGRRDEAGVQSMRAVWCHFGGPTAGPDDKGTVAVLALLSTPQAVLINGRAHLGLIVPTAPVPVGGGLLFVPEEWVTPADVGVEALTSIYISLGITASQYLPAAPRRVSAAQPLPLPPHAKG